MVNSHDVHQFAIRDWSPALSEILLNKPNQMFLQEPEQLIPDDPHSRV